LAGLGTVPTADTTAADKAAITAWNTKHALYTAYATAGPLVLKESKNLVAWNKNAIDAETTVAGAKAIQSVNVKACALIAKADKATNASCMMAADDNAAVAELTKKIDAQTAKWTKATKASAKANTYKGKNFEDAKAELERLTALSRDAKWEAAQCTDKDSAECKHLASVSSALAADVTTQAAYNKVATNFHHSSNATIAIIIICVSAVVCISGGCIWRHVDKKKAAAKEAEHAKIEAEVEGAPAMDAAMDAAVNFNDDNYTAMVDAEM
jgi:hypothetical protein